MPITDSPVLAMSPQDFLDMLDQLLPDHYIAPLKSPGPGYEVLQAYAQMFAKVSLGVQHIGEDAQISTADDGAYATGQVELYRLSPAAADVVVKAGTVVTTSKGGRDFTMQADVTFLAADLGPKTVAVKAVATGYEWNVPGLVTAADSEALPGDIDTMKTLVEDPALLDVNIKVRNIAATSGGEDGSLSSLGADRGILRQSGESVDKYRLRVRGLPDTVSPMALYRTVLDILRSYGVAFVMIETYDITYQTCWDGPPNAIAGSQYNPNLFCYDDPRSPIPFRNRWLDTNDFRGGIIVAVYPIQPLLYVGMVWDETNSIPAQLVSPVSGGIRATSAYDVPPEYSATPQGFWDGEDYRLNSTYLSIYDTLQSIKPAGVSAVLELLGQ